MIYAILPSVFDKIQGILCVRHYSKYSNLIYAHLGMDTSIAVCILPLTAIMLEQQQKFLQKE